MFGKIKPDFLVEDTEYFNTEECDYSDNGSLFGIHEVLISEDDTLESLNMIGPNMSAGPDGIPGILLKTNAESLAKPLTLFWRKSMESEKIPKRLKLA